MAPTENKQLREHLRSNKWVAATRERLSAYRKEAALAERNTPGHEVHEEGKGSDPSEDEFMLGGKRRKEAAEKFKDIRQGWATSWAGVAPERFTFVVHGRPVQAIPFAVAEPVASRVTDASES